MFGNPSTGCDERMATEIVSAYMDSGGNFVDVADFYGDGTAESVLGAAIKGRRDELVLASKVGMWHADVPNARGLSRKHILAAVDASLRRLGTDYLDLYQVHTVDPWTPLEETLSAMDACVSAGKVRYVGCSNIEAWRLMKALGIARERSLTPFSSVQLHYSLVTRDIEREHVGLCLSEGVAILPYSVLGAGLLTGKVRRGAAAPAGSRIAQDPRYVQRATESALDIVEVLVASAASAGRSPSQLAIAWAASRPGITSVIVGARTVEQIEDNLGAVGLKLDQTVAESLDAASAPKRGYPYESIDEYTKFVAPAADVESSRHAGTDVPGLRVLQGSPTVRVGLYFDMRNPAGWRRPWHPHYGRTVELVGEAEGLGIDSVWLTEHHLIDDGYLSQPLTFASALAVRTRRVRLGTAVLLAGLRHPLQLAEEAALVDVLSNGRLELGVGSGYRVPEFAAFGVDHRRRYTVLQQTIESVISYWSSGSVVPKPIQEPLPLWGGFFGQRGARLAGVMDMGLLALRSELLDAYTAGLIEAGHPASRARVGGPVSVVLSDDPERDWTRLRPHFAYQRDSYHRYGAEGTDRPAPQPVDVGERMQARRGKVPTLGVMTPEDAASAIRALIGDMPVTDIFIWASIGAMPDDLQERHIELVCRELRPALIS
jgi:aryl-alcohol dehydrogenase-like predicted oxidoreductase/alkanesulfonate monooxygenase SsuD/methylene tetrahydromethanopterin reductase-like flavin-dependent oxidoreductase (luciferase family)